MSKINQKLLTEIFRQKELMGIKQILSEGVGLNTIKDFFNISDIDQTYTKIFDDVMEEIKSTNPSLIQDIETNFRMNDVSFSSLKNSPIRRTVNFSQNSTILENLLYDLTKSLTKVIYSGKNPAYEKLADEIIEESLKGLSTNKQAYDIMVNLAISGEREKLEEYISRLGNYFDSEIINYIRNVKLKQKNPWYDKLYEQIRKKFGEGWVLTVKGWDKIKDFSLYLKELTKKNSVLEGVFTSQPISPIAKLMHLNYNKLMVTPNEIKRDLDDIFNRIMDKLERGEGTDIEGEQKELTAKFAQFLSKRDESHKMIFNQWMNDWKQDPRLNRLFNENLQTGLDASGKPIIVPEPFYFKNGFTDPKFLEIIERFEKATGTTKIDEIKKTYSKYHGTIEMLKNMGGLIKFRSGRYFLNLFELAQRLIGTVIFWTPNTLKELAYNKRMLGTKRWVGLGVGQKLVTSVLITPALLAAYKTLGSALQDMVNEERRVNATKEGKTPELVDWWLLDDNEWSKILSKYPGYEGVGRVFLKNFGDFSLTNIESLGTKPAAWSLAAWYLINNLPKDFKPRQVKDQEESIKTNHTVTVDSLNQMAQQDPEIKKVVDSMKIQSYDTLVQNIDTTLKLSNLEY